MRIFVAGATGVVGRPTVRLLVEAGHAVTAVSRTPAKTATLEEAGATAVTLDLFDPLAVKAAVAGHDVVANLATHIPKTSRAALPGAWNDNDRLRREASRHLVAGALAGGAARYVQESITFLYPDGGDRWLDEDDQLDPVPYAMSTLDAEASAARFTAAGGTGVVLRFAAFYGPESHQTVGFVRAARKRLALHPGPPEAYLSSIHTADAATAVVAALGVASGVYNVTDDEPMRRRDYDTVLAGAVGVAKLRRPPAALARLGGSKLSLLTRSQRVNNRRFREAAGWIPEYPSLREGLPSVVTTISRGHQ